MKKFIITEDEKRRILGLHEGFKKGVLSEDVSGTTTGATVSGYTADNNPPKSQKAIEWGKDKVTGVATSKQYPITVSNMTRSPGEEPVTFNMYITLQKSSSRDGSWLGYAMRIYDAKSKKMQDQLSIDCQTVDSYLNSTGWTQIDHFGKSEYKWFFNKQFLNDLKQTLGCK